MLARQMEIDEDEITMDTNIIEDLGADSLDAVELIMNIEDVYGIMISDDDAKNLFTVRQVVEFLEENA
jgi:acyl carrier protein